MNHEEICARIGELTAAKKSIRIGLSTGEELFIVRIGRTYRLSVPLGAATVESEGESRVIVRQDFFSKRTAIGVAYVFNGGAEERVRAQVRVDPMDVASIEEALA